MFIHKVCIYSFNNDTDRQIKNNLQYVWKFKFIYMFVHYNNKPII